MAEWEENDETELARAHRMEPWQKRVMREFMADVG